MPPDADSVFLEEVLGLFALEAQEWVSQATQALAELEAGCESARAVKLYDGMIRGMSNLAGSAATVELGQVEQLALELLPVLQGLRQQDGPAPRAQLAAVHGHLAEILTAVHQLGAGTPDLTSLSTPEHAEPSGTSASPDPSQASLPPEPALGLSPPASEEPSRPVDREEPEPVVSRSQQLYEALIEVLEAQARSPDGTRHSAEVVLRKAQGDTDEVEEAAVVRALREIELLDEQFLVEVRKRAPVINQTFSSFSQPPNGKATADRTRLFHEIEHLFEISRFVNSTPIMLYLQGLRSFLHIASERPALIPTARFDAVGGRVAMLEALAQRWVDIGRDERASIEKLLTP